LFDEQPEKKNRFLWTECLCPAPNSHFEILTLLVMISRGEASGKPLGHESGLS
jgi:hypothetical protein